MSEPSGKESVEEPARRDLRPIKAGAEEPEAAPLLVLDPVIIARGLALAAAAPPFTGDALGSVGAAHPMCQTAPAEENRRIIRHRRHRLDRLRPRQEPDRASSRRRPGGVGAGREHRRKALGPLGHMALARRETADRLRPEPA